MEHAPLLKTPAEKNVFVMMRYRDTDQFKRIEDAIRTSLKNKGLNAMLAKDYQHAPQLWDNICEYMDHCRYGIAVFDAYPLAQGEPRLNPNVCTELGYMLAKNRPCLLLKDKSLEHLQTDVRGFIYETFDGDRLAGLEEKVAIWVDQTVRVFPLIQAFAQLLPDSKVADRLNENSYEKQAIAKYLALEFFPEELGPRSIILDSGTTIAAVAEILSTNRAKYKQLTIHTNNLLASLLLSPVNHFDCQVLPGKVDENFAGVFGQKTIDAVKTINADCTILACTAFTSEHGPYANSLENRQFKRAILELNKNTIIVVTADRLGKKTGLPVFDSQEDWKRVLNENISMIVTCPKLQTQQFKAHKTALKRKLKVVEV